jgi:hypothetical protein
MSTTVSVWCQRQSPCDVNDSLRVMSTTVSVWCDCPSRRGSKSCQLHLPTVWLILLVFCPVCMPVVLMQYLVCVRMACRREERQRTHARSAAMWRACMMYESCKCICICICICIHHCWFAFHKPESCTHEVIHVWIHARAWAHSCVFMYVWIDSMYSLTCDEWVNSCTQKIIRTCTYIGIHTHANSWKQPLSYHDLHWLHSFHNIYDIYVYIYMYIYIYIYIYIYKRLHNVNNLLCFLY